MTTNEWKKIDKLKRFQKPEAYQILVKSPAMQNALQKFGGYYYRYHSLVIMEEFMLLYIFVVAFLFFSKILTRIGLVGSILVALVGIASVVAVFIPIDIGLLYRRWYVWKKKILNMLHAKRIDKYLPLLLFLGKQKEINRRKEKRQRKLEKKYHKFQRRQI